MAISAIIALIFSVLSGILGLVTTGMTSGINALKKENGELKLVVADQAGKLAASDAKAALQVAEAVARRELLIKELKAELEIMENDNATKTDPVATRARLSKLLSVP